MHCHTMPPWYICLQILQLHLLHFLLQWGILPTSIQKPSGIPSCNPSRHPVLKPPQCPFRAWVVTHFSDPKISTSYTTALNNTLNTHGLAPSHPNIFYKRTHFFLAFLRFPTTTSQLSLEAIRIQPMYLNDFTDFSGFL